MHKIKFIELSSGSSHDGPAWVANVEFSKSGRTLYFDGRALKKELGTHSNYSDAETEEEFWVYDPQRDGLDRDNSKNGLAYVDDTIADEYARFLKVDALDPGKYEIVKMKSKNANANKPKKPAVEDPSLYSSDLQYDPLEDLSEGQLNWLIDYYTAEAESADKKSQRVLKQSKIKVIEELTSREK